MRALLILLLQAEMQTAAAPIADTPADGCCSFGFFCFYGCCSYGGCSCRRLLLLWLLLLLTAAAPMAAAPADGCCSS